MVTENIEPQDEDYRARWEEATAQLEKVQNDLKAVSTGQMRQKERDDLLRKLAERQEEIDLKFKYFGEALLNGGDPEEIRTGMQRESEELTQRRASEDWQRYYDDVKTRLMDITGEDVVNAPEYEQLRNSWLAAMEGRNAAGLERLIADAKDISAQRKEPPKKEEEEERPVRMSTAPTSGGNGSYSSRNDLVRAWLAGSIDKNRFEELYPQYNR